LEDLEVWLQMLPPELSDIFHICMWYIL
jgi:hypothetical protein